MYVMFGWVGLGIVFTLGKTDELLKKSWAVNVEKPVD
jgi:hypothetical protein